MQSPLLTSEINSAIEKQQRFPYLRDKVVGRVTECAFLFKSLAIASTETELKKSLVEAAGVSQEAAILIAESIPMERYDGIINAAHYSVAQILKHHYRREFVFLLWSCKSLNEVNGIDQAVQELTF